VIRAALAFLIASGIAAETQAQSPPTIASLGTCKLASGAVIPDCRVAYRAFGRLNAARTNAVLIPTWLLGRSEQWLGMLGPTKLVDTTQFFTIVVDAFADGNSSSPSNTAAAGRAAFADLTLTDMVDAQHRLVTESLKLRRLHAVMGVSMGGMQSFEWAVRYPDFMDAVVPIMGAPKVGTYDQLLWSTTLSVIENGRHAGMSDDSVWTEVARIIALFLRTPGAVDASAWPQVAMNVQNDASNLRRTWSLDDYTSQIRAALRHDVSAPFGGDMARAAAQVRARMLIVYSWGDHMVTPGLTVEFARLVNADTLSLGTTCGHIASGCEEARVGTAVRAFLSQTP
jgi:homoserine acetyltransferase